MPRLTRLTWLYLFVLLLAWGLGEFVAERTLPTLLLAYLPPVLLAWPAPALLLAALIVWAVRKEARSVIPAVLVCLAALVYAGFTWHAPQPALPGDLTLLTYNVARGGFGRAASLADQIRASAPDLVTLQETNGLRPGFADALIAALPGYQVSRSGTPGAEMLTLSRFPVRATRTAALPGTTRRFLVTRLATPQGELTLINVHLSTVMVSQVRQGRVMPTRDRRQVQLDILLREAASIRGPLIVSGDFNTPPRGSLYRALTIRFADAWDSAGRGLGDTFQSK